MKKLKFVLFIFLIFIFSLNTYAYYYPKNFVDSLDNGELYDKALVEELQRILTSYHIYDPNGYDTVTYKCPAGYSDHCYKHITLGYTTARRYLFGYLHLKQSENSALYIKDVYCDREFTNYDFGGSGLGYMQIPNSNIMNCEHTWPQSKFNSRLSINTQKSDLHHLFPTDSKSNSVRGNHPFSDVEGRTVHNKCGSSSIGESSYGEYAFEPPPHHKGNVARALFYFSIRYNIEIPDNQEYFLKLWNTLDPVDEEELIRNQQILEIQGNRNPFIDFPALSNLISNF